MSGPDQEAKGGGELPFPSTAKRNPVRRTAANLALGGLAGIYE